MNTLIRLRCRVLIIPLVLTALLAASARDDDKYETDAKRLAQELNWREGSVVGDVGAGGGEIMLAAARVVGAAGRVYATELDRKKLTYLQGLAAKEKNITVLEAGVDQTNLPPACCDSIFLRLVYHHLTKPAEIDASLLQSLKPGGLLAVIDEEPKPGSKRVEGVPENRGGHGVPEKIVIDELTLAGFQFVKSFEDWPDNHYCVVFRKPNP